MQHHREKSSAHVLVISADRFEDSELLEPRRQLEEAGVSVDIASPTRGTIHGKRGAEVHVDLTTDEVAPKEYDMLLLPGGRAPAQLRDDEGVRRIAKTFFAADKPVAAICHGPQILISAGLMEGRRATAYPSVADELRAAGAHYVDREVMVDGNLVTSRRPDDIPAFMREIMAKLLSTR